MKKYIKTKIQKHRNTGENCGEVLPAHSPSTHASPPPPIYTRLHSLSSFLPQSVLTISINDDTFMLSNNNNNNNNNSIMNNNSNNLNTMNDGNPSSSQQNRPVRRKLTSQATIVPPGGAMPSSSGASGSGSAPAGGSASTIVGASKAPIAAGNTASGSVFTKIQDASHPPTPPPISKPQGSEWKGVGRNVAAGRQEHRGEKEQRRLAKGESASQSEEEEKSESEEEDIDWEDCFPDPRPSSEDASGQPDGKGRSLKESQASASSLPAPVVSPNDLPARRALSAPSILKKDGSKKAPAVEKKVCGSPPSFVC
jgi:hypothetical protein